MTNPTLALLSLIFAAATAWLGEFWLEKLYRESPAILSFPERLGNQRLRLLRRAALFLSAFALACLQLAKPPAIENILALLMQALLFYMTVSDIEQQVIFDKTLYPLAALGIAASALSAAPLNHALAALGGGAIFLLLAILTRGGIGGGDIKLIAALGLCLGSDKLLAVAAAGIILGGVFALLALVTGFKKKGEAFAYGPFFSLTAIYILLMNSI